MTVAYPLEVGPSGRHLVDADGDPFLLVGDAQWSLFVNGSREEVECYLEDRRRRGFTGVIADLIESLLARDPPRNLYGDAPFTIPGDFSTPNEPYWEHAEWIVGTALEKGILLLLEPCYLGYPDPSFTEFRSKAEGFYHEVLTNGVDACEAYGRFVGRRFRDYPNVVWVMAGDRNPDDALEHVRAMARGILAESPGALMTTHVLPESKGRTIFADDDWLTVNATYTYGIAPRELLRDYNREPVKPSFFFETAYENMHNAPTVQVRRCAWWSVLCGGFGHCMGNLPLFWFGPGWEDELGSPGSRSLETFGAFFRRHPWYSLVPDQEKRILTAGYGEANGLDRCTLAAASNRCLAIAYMPTARMLTVDLGELTGPRTRVTWFDPITGQHRPLGVLRQRGPVDLVPPSAQDWALVLEATD